MSRAARTVGFTAAATDLFLLVAAYFGAYELRYHMGWFPGVYNWDRYLFLLLVAIPVWQIVGWSSGLYDGRRRGIAGEFLRITAAALAGALVLAALAFLLKQQHQSRPLVVLYMALAWAQACGVRGLVRLLAVGRPDETSRVIVIGSGEGATALCQKLSRTKGLQLVGVIVEEEGAPTPQGARRLGTLAESEAILRREVVDEVIFSVHRGRLADMEHAFEVAEDLGLDAKICLDFLPHRTAKLDFEELEGTPLLSFWTAPAHPVQMAIKRAFDVVVSGAALLVGAPIFLAIAAAVKFTSPGPIFFGQVRSGLNGREFRLWKFRSMVVDAENRLDDLRVKNEMGGPVFKLSEDPRVTGVGRFLRRTSLDELPQFWNVLLGDMSVVGPRPPLPAEVKQYARWQRRRLSVKPGITCIWQVSGRNEIDFETWMKLDLDYIDRWSLWLDLKIFVKTIPAVLLGRGAR